MLVVGLVELDHQIIMLELEARVELVAVEIQDMQLNLQEEEHLLVLLLMEVLDLQILVEVVEAEPIKAHHLVQVQMVELEVQE
jgi:hypothetical protein